MASVAAINDLSGVGKCSLTIVLPVLSAMGQEVHPVPTAILSAHTGYAHYSFLDFTPHMKEYLLDWKQHGFHFDCVFSGFLGSEIQIEYISDFIASTQKDTLIVIDPVMGDNGHAYRTYTQAMCTNMRNLIQRADLITPNLTEASILLEESYPQHLSVSQAESWLKRLHRMGPKKVVITGIQQEEQWLNYAYDSETEICLITKNSNAEACYGGTGDLFTSILTGSLLQGISFPDAVKKATTFTSNAVRYSKEQNVPEKNGLLFEPLLKEI